MCVRMCVYAFVYVGVRVCVFVRARTCKSCLLRESMCVCVRGGGEEVCISIRVCARAHAHTQRHKVDSWEREREGKKGRERESVCVHTHDNESCRERKSHVTYE